MEGGDRLLRHVPFSSFAINFAKKEAAANKKGGLMGRGRLSLHTIVIWLALKSSKRLPGISSSASESSVTL